MKKYDTRGGKSRRALKIALISFVVMFVVAIVAGVFTLQEYNEALKPISNDTTAQVVTIEEGMGTQDVSDMLEERGLIRESWAFYWHVYLKRLNNFQAGVYSVSPHMSSQEIIQLFNDGDVVADPLITLLPGKRLDETRAALVEEFDKAEVDTALNPKLYKDHKLFKGQELPGSLEGYIYPESFFKSKETTASDIIRLALDEMALHLTTERRAAYTKAGLSVHEAVILASIIEQEVSDEYPEDKSKVAQVFLSRIKLGMPLGSDPTAYYGSRKAGQGDSVFYDTPYNTRIHAGLPPSPIGNVGKNSLQALANPSNTDYLYFVSGDPDENGKSVTHFSRTQAEHEALTERYCTTLCGR